MADPRAVINTDGIDQNFMSFNTDNSTIVYDVTKPGGSVSVGLAVMLSADNTVALTNDGASIIGKLMSVESDNLCSVQVDGFCSLPGGNAATLTRGTKAVGALGAASARGYIRSAASAVAAELNTNAVVIYAVADPTAVSVCIS